MRKVLFAFLFYAFGFAAPALAVGINYTGDVTSLDINGPTVLGGEFAVNQQISGQLIFDDTTGEISLFTISNGISTWGYFDAGKNVIVQTISGGIFNEFLVDYNFTDPAGSGPILAGHELLGLQWIYDEFAFPTTSPILNPPTLPSLADLVAMVDKSLSSSNAFFTGSADWRDDNGSIARLRFKLTGITEIQAVPLPAPFLLLSAGLVALFGIPRLRRRRTA